MLRYIPKAEREAAAAKKAEEEAERLTKRAQEEAEKKRKFFESLNKMDISDDPYAAGEAKMMKMHEHTHEHAHEHAHEPDSALARMNLLDLDRVSQDQSAPVPAVSRPKTNRKKKDPFECSETEDTSEISTNFQVPNFSRKTDLLEKIACANDPEYAKRRKTAPQDEISQAHGISSKAENWRNKLEHEMTERDWRIFREDQRISVKGGRVPPPFRIWQESNLPRDLLRAVSKAGYARPTAVQMQAIPVGLECRDLIAVAVTGSGKTAAFLLPMMTMMKGKGGPYGLVLAPTRELAVQIETEAKKFAAFSELRVCCVIGGRSVEQQAFDLAAGCELIVATPGRLADALEQRIADLSSCWWVVLDEADKMIDMGHEAFVHAVLDSIPVSNLKSENELEAGRQEKATKLATLDQEKFRVTQMFSATMPPVLEKLARKFLRAPAVISVGEIGEGKQDIDQLVEMVTETQKRNALSEALAMTNSPIIVFANSKKTCDAVGRFVEQEGYRTVVLHSGKQQAQREEVMATFRDKRADVLVATDVAGRGIDVDGVQHVINYEMPKSIEDYTHRIGRTGRAGKRGLATTFLTSDDSEIFFDLRRFLLTCRQRVPDALENAPESKTKPGQEKHIIY